MLRSSVPMAGNMRLRIISWIYRRRYPVLISSVVIVILFNLLHLGVQKCPTWIKSRETKEANLFRSEGVDEVVMVTGYFNLGSFQKGDTLSKSQFTPNTYTEWMEKFKLIANPIVAYFDDPRYAKHFKSIRQNLPEELTQIVIVKRQDLWAFRIVPQIDKVFTQPGYPKHHPNTVVPEYSAAMHVKFELLVNASKISNFKKFQYFAWVDIGYLREAHDLQRFKFGIPEAFDRDKVAFNFVTPRIGRLIPKEIVYGNHVWVGGGFVLGHVDNLKLFFDIYKESVHEMLKMGLMSTDQQVIYSMYSSDWPIKRTVEIQAMNCGKPNLWFYLGALSREQWLIKQGLNISCYDNQIRNLIESFINIFK